MNSAYRQTVRPAYLTRKQAADHFAVSTRTIDRWVDAGKLTPVHDDAGPRSRGVTIESVEALTKRSAK